MLKATIVAGTLATLALVFGVIVPRFADERGVPTAVARPARATPPSTDARTGLLHGRVTTTDGKVYEGRLRFGADEEALWSNYFNGFKKGNPWADHAPLDQLPGERRSWTVLGIRLSLEPAAELRRPFMARFGDISRLEADGSDLWVTLRSGRVVHLDRYAADDFADGVRVWDGGRGILDLPEGQIRSIELFSGPLSGPAPAPLYGTVRTEAGEFTGFIQWEREACLASDDLHGYGDDGQVSLRFETIRSIAPSQGSGAVVTLLDGQQIHLSRIRRDKGGNRGMYVDDPRYGRVLVSWDAFEGLELAPGGNVPAYDEYAPGRPLTGTVVTQSGRSLSGRLVYDLDESETIETLDAPAAGIDYTIPFNRIASIEPVDRGESGARITLRSGEALRLERAGDLDDHNAGLLVFGEGRQRAEYVPWAEVARVELR